MPPRKKTAAAVADGDSAPATTRATRSSTRTKKPTSTAAAAPVSKSRAKRARAASDDEADDAPNAKPVSKKAKKKADATQKDDAMDEDKDKKDVGNEDKDKDKNEDDQKTATPPPVDEPKKMVTIMKRGAAPVDPMSGKVDTHIVLSYDQGVWDAMLNQTDVSGGNNKNKFYVIQVLHPLANAETCYLYTRWGRVGENGQTQIKGPWNPIGAVNEFKKQFRSKTGVAWDSRVGMVAGKGKYTWLERNFEDDDDSKEDNGEGARKKEEKVPDSKLDAEIQDFCNLIFSTKLIDAALSSMNYDAKKLPLGKLAKSTILNGFTALKHLAEVITQPGSDLIKEHRSQRAACEHLSSVYYSIIPHDFGRQRPVVIDSEPLLKRELDLVDALGDMEVASKLISSTILADEDGNPLNPLDAHFRSLGLSFMSPIKRDTQEFNVLEKYVRDTHGHTHNIQVSVQHAYKVERNAETEAWKNAGFDALADGERLLLWHGSRTTNYAGILKQGLRIAPPEAPVTGYMFGKGVYFADMMSKSANYCHVYLSNQTGLLLLCEVAALPFYERYQAQYDADVHCKSQNKRATKGIGRTAPVKWKDAGEALGNDELKGCHMPEGPGATYQNAQAYLEYNEYIVYDPSQIRLRYLLMVKM